MEAVLIWGAAVIVVVVVVFGYVRSFRRRRAGDRERLDLSREIGMDRASGQYPLIDTNRCIGCATCVDACPEGDVLGVVMGKATVINGARCIGHGQCALACPVGAIEVGLGDVTARDDIPLLDENNQTNIPGLWIAGELSGFALINNAVDQGAGWPRPSPTGSSDDRWPTRRRSRRILRRCTTSSSSAPDPREWPPDWSPAIAGSTR